MFNEARTRMALPQEISVLNAVAKGEYESARSAGSATYLMRWFEVFRDIYVASCVRAERDSHAPGRNPNDFSTFARTFEPLAFLPDFWFENRNLTRERDVCAMAHPVRLAFERYLYCCTGGRAWGAMDWEMWRYVEKRMADVRGKNAAEPVRRIVALALAMRGILSGELGLYVEERDDVTLPMTGLSNAAGQQPPLLTYYHYDRFTQLSYTREHEFAVEYGAAGDHMKFEERWLGLAVLSDFILKEAHARSTLAAASRVARGSFATCLSRIVDKFGSSRPDVVCMAENLGGLFEDPLRTPETEDVLKCVGESRSVMRADNYLIAAGLSTPEIFWERTGPIFRELRVRFETCHNSVVAAYTQKQMTHGLVRAPDAQERYLSEVFNFGDGNEIPMVLDKPVLRKVLGKCLSGGGFEMQYGVMAAVLFGAGPLQGRIPVLSHLTHCSRSIPQGALFGGGERERFRTWLLGVWTELAAKRSAGAMGEQGRAFLIAHAHSLRDHARQGSVPLACRRVQRQLPASGAHASQPAERSGQDRGP